MSSITDVNFLPQSAFARYVLLKQLSAVALHNPQTEGRTSIDIVVNDGEYILEHTVHLIWLLRDSLGE